MAHARYLALLALTAVLGWTALMIVIFRLDPYTSTALAIPLFFATLFFALVGTLALGGFYSRVWFRRGEVFYQHIGISLRQAILFTLVVCFALAFQMLNILTWWNGFLIAAAMGLVEIYFSSRD